MELVEDFITKHSLRNVSRRNSCKVFFNGEVDTERFTYCFGTICENYIIQLANLLCSKKEAILYLSRRCNPMHSFILSFAKNSVRFYLDNSFRPGDVAIYSVEITDDIVTYREYKSEPWLKIYLPPNMKSIENNLKVSSRLVRDDGQVYFRFNSSDLPSCEKLSLLSDNYHFKEWLLNQKGVLVWFQFSLSSFTVYYKNI